MPKPNMGKRKRAESTAMDVLAMFATSLAEERDSASESEDQQDQPIIEQTQAMEEEMLKRRKVEEMAVPVVSPVLAPSRAGIRSTGGLYGFNHRMGALSMPVMEQHAMVEQALRAKLMGVGAGYYGMPEYHTMFNMPLHMHSVWAAQMMAGVAQ